ncbi:MAG: hypothetical protein ACRCRW_02400 [Aeromonadaceae bacterium]
MKYQIVGGAGLHRSETKTVDMMIKRLPDSWFGYAGWWLLTVKARWKLMF